MKQLNFKKIKAQNFFCFGNKGIEIDFEQYNNIILINGINKDVVDQNGKFSSNGSGKSTIPQILTYCFYGKPIKSPKKISHKDIINNKNAKKLNVEVTFDNYKIIRTRKPDSLRVWKSDDNIWDDSTEITLGGMPSTQELINNIIGLSYESFLNVCIFTDDNNSCFLELEAIEKRKIVENLLNLEKYRIYLEVTKDLIKENKDNNKKTIESNISIIKRNIESYKTNLINEINIIDKKIQDLKNQIVNSSYDEDFKKYEDAQENIKKIDSALEALETKKTEVSLKIQGLYESYKKAISNKSDHDLILTQEKNNVSVILKIINELNARILKFKNIEPNITCDNCYGTINPENYKEFFDKAIIDKDFQELEIEKAKEKLNEELIKQKDLSEKINALSENINKIKTFHEKISAEETKHKNGRSIYFSVKKPEQTNQEIIIRTKVESLQEEKADKDKQLIEKNPHEELLDQNNKSLEEIKEKHDDIKKQIADTEALYSYYDFWADAFGDDGIRKFVINEIVPSLNSKLDYWLQILIDNKIKVSFDDSLNETITKYPDNDKELIYAVLSNGQKRRINLAVTQAFAHVMMLSHGICPNILFLDEISTNIDSIGIQAIYNMICELSKNKKVFITTHDQELISMLSGCQEITLELKNGESSLK